MNRELIVKFRCLMIMAILTIHWNMPFLWGVMSITGKFYVCLLIAAAAYIIYSRDSHPIRTPAYAKSPNFIRYSV